MNAASILRIIFILVVIIPSLLCDAFLILSPSYYYYRQQQQQQQQHCSAVLISENNNPCSGIGSSNIGTNRVIKAKTSSTQLLLDISSSSYLSNTDSKKSRNYNNNNNDDEIVIREDDNMIISPKSQYEQLKRFRRKRRTILRVVEIASVVIGDIIRPILCSLTKGPLSEDWNSFWSRSYHNKTNAQYVVDGFQRLGPTYVKIGQALATRPDFLNTKLAESLSTLQDQMKPFDNLIAKRIIRRNLREHKYFIEQPPYVLDEFINNLSDKPIAAASIAQVYKGYLPKYGNVAVKVKRPGIRKLVERDATLFHTIATWIESASLKNKTIPLLKPLQKLNNDNKQLIAINSDGNSNSTTNNNDINNNKNNNSNNIMSPRQIIDAVDEFMTRVLEDMDFKKEGQNMRTFYNMYSIQKGASKSVKVIVPELYIETDKVLVMEWIDGEKLTNINKTDINAVIENMQLLQMGIECTMGQLFDEGIIHADPHSGNLLKVRNKDGTLQLGYLDFGNVNYVPQKVRDLIVCVVVELVFARKLEAIADLFIELELLPKEKLKEPYERKEFLNALKQTADEVLEWTRDRKGRATDFPTIHFENLLSSMIRLIGQFDFTIPPYFLNNARTLATLEGIAKELDPSFNVLRVIYPYAINRLMKNPSVSDVVEDTFMDICRSPETTLFDPSRVKTLINDWALFTGYKKRKVFFDIAMSTGWRRVSKRIMQEWLCYHTGICVGRKVNKRRRPTKPKYLLFGL